MIEHEKIYIDGKWVGASGSARIVVVDPSTEQEIGRFRSSSVEDVDSAVTAAKAAFASWSTTTPVERAAFLADAAAQLNARLAEIGTLIARDVGMPLPLSMMIQAGLPARVMDSYAKLTPVFDWESEVGNSLIIREPAGVVGAITPWNYPLHQLVAKTAAALAAGCTVVAKPSEVAPLSAYVLAEIFDAVGLPAGVFNLVAGDLTIGQALVEHPGVDVVSFTGSARAGTDIASRAAQRLARVTLELGGKSANIMLDDAPIAESVDAAVTKCFLNSGQTCTALTRLVVPRSILSQVEEAAVASAKRFVLGEPTNPATRLGPVVSETQRERVRAYIRGAIADGTRLLCGGSDTPAETPVGFFVAPTVFSDVDNASKIAQEEVFGPVLCIIAYDSEEQAIAIANDSTYGLSGGVMSRDTDRAIAVARRIKTGQVGINNGAFNPEAPFGGVKKSGYGRELGAEGLHEYLAIKAIHR
jgi:acyl-CoA reductase-like NAD-dependent aldehyde dehydrogenase